MGIILLDILYYMFPNKKNILYFKLFRNRNRVLKMRKYAKIDNNYKILVI